MLVIYRKYIMFFFLLAFTIKALVPVGIMPEKSTDGKVEIVICDGYGSVTRLVNRDQTPFTDHEQEQDKDQEHSSPPCPYAPLLTQSMDGLSTVSIPAAIYQNDLYIFHAESFLQIRTLKPYQSQAPPVSLT